MVSKPGQERTAEEESRANGLARISAIFAQHYNNEGSDPTDLLTDLLHWCRSPRNITGQPFNDHLRIARSHFKAES